MLPPEVEARADSTAQTALESLRPHQRLRHRLAYVRCYRAGRKRHGRLISLHVHGNDQSHPRLGITASRKVGNAVVRHRLKRWSRDVFRRSPLRRRLSSVDIVVHLKPQAAAVSYSDFRQELDRLMRSFVQHPRGGGVSQ